MLKTVLYLIFHFDILSSYLIVQLVFLRVKYEAGPFVMLFYVGLKTYI